MVRQKSIKAIYPILLLGLLGSCSGTGGGGGNDISVELDTVMIDPGEEILYLKNGLFNSSLSGDGRYLYNFNSDQYLMEKIDLKELRLDSRHKFEKQGPNGVGNYLSRVIPAGNEAFMFVSFVKGGGIYSLDGKLRQKVEMKGGRLSGDSLKLNENIYSGVLLGSKLFGTFSDYMTETFYLGVLDYEAKTFKRIDFPEQAYQKDYFIALHSKSGHPLFVAGPNYFLNEVNGLIYISNNLDNSIHTYNPETHELQRFEVKNKLFPIRKTGNYPKTSEDRERFNAYLAEYKNEINFSQPVWDPSRKRFYRFSYLTHTKDQADGKAINEYEVFLTVLDKDLQLLQESKLENFTKRPSYHFVKDGQIWMFENIEDELGFIRLAVQ